MTHRSFAIHGFLEQSLIRTRSPIVPLLELGPSTLAKSAISRTAYTMIETIDLVRAGRRNKLGITERTGDVVNEEIRWNDGLR